MQEWMRKHRRIIFTFIFAFIGVPMVIFLIPMGGGRRGGQDPRQTQSESVIAQVGGIPITEAEYRQRLDALAAQRAQQGMGRPTYEELEKDGTATRALEQLTDAALIKLQEKKRAFSVNEQLLAKQMQKFQMFQDEEGNFNPDAWNEWVQSIENFDEIYEDVQETVTRQVYLGTITASSGRILKKKIDDELLAEQTKLKFKHAKVELLITPSEEELLAHYNDNPDTYREPELNQVEFLKISIIPEVPELALQLVERARNGEDFAALATEFSDVKEPEGGAMGWRRAGDFVSPQLEPFFALAYNEVSDPVLGPNGYIIYKVEEERFNDVTGEREINGRQIQLNVEIDPAVLAEREKMANEIATKLRGGADIHAVAAEYGLDVLRTDFFNRMKLEIENIHHEDIYTFRGQMLAEDAEPWTMVKAKRHLYIGKIIEKKPGELPPFEDVREKAVENVKNERKRTDEYRERLEEKINIIKAQVDKVDNIKGLDADLAVEVGQIEEPVTRKDSLFQKKIYVQTTEIFDALKDKAVGEVGGPVKGFLGEYWFFELLERDAPTPEKLAEMTKERKEVKDRIVQTAQYEILADFTKNLRETEIANTPFTQDNEAFDRILGRNQKGEGVELIGEGEGAAEEGEAAADTAAAEGEQSQEGETVADTAATAEAASETAAPEGESETAATADSTPEAADTSSPETPTAETEPATTETSDPVADATAVSVTEPVSDDTSEAAPEVSTEQMPAAQ